MVATRVIVGVGLATAIAAAWAVAPAMGADERPLPRRATAPTVGIGSFTPASGDPRLAAVLARAGISGNGFRFTPSGAGKPGARALTVAVRARSSDTATAAVAADRLPAATPVALAPTAYNLGVAVGWKRFALSGDLAKVDLAGQPGSRESADLGVSYNGRAFSGRVKAEAARPLAGEPRLIADSPSYSLDVGGAYRIARNLDVTAGVRYKTERERLPQLTDNRRDSQSVYVGTAFRF